MNEPPTDAPKKKKKKRGKGGNEAEKIFKAWLELQGYLVHRAAATGFHKFEKKDGASGFMVQSHDLFGALDLLAIQREFVPETWAIQVTTQSGLGARRVRVAAVKWPTSWRISIFTHETIPNPANRTRKLHFARVEDWDGSAWSEAKAIPFDHVAVEAHRRATASPRKPRKAKSESKLSHT